jgi:anion transporter
VNFDFPGVVGMKQKLKLLAYFLFVVFASNLWFIPEIEGLTTDGKRSLVFILLAIFLWTTGIIAHAFTTFFLFICFILADIATANDLFSFFLTPLVWMIVGSYLISHAIRKSGLAKRISYYFTLKFVDSYTSLITFIFFLGFILSIIIPHPFPRVFLMMSIVDHMINNTDMDETTKRYVGFSVFVSVTVTGTIFLTGDTLLNGSAFTLAGMDISWWVWFKAMSVPGITTSILTLFAYLFIFRQKDNFTLNKNLLKQQLDSMGSFTPAEWKVSIWVGLAVLLWITEPLHHVNPAWIALLSTTGLALPKVGDLLDEEDISKNVNWNIILFIVGALSIGSIGYKTGMSYWVLNLLTPSHIPQQITFTILTIVLLSTLIHMLIGSASATMSLIIPPIIQMFPEVDSLVVSLIVYTTVAFHYFLPFHSVVILLGAGKGGYFTQKEVLKFGIPLSIILTIITLLIEPLWWKLVGFL